MFIALAYVLLVAAWLMSSRPFAGPDEVAHYIKAIAISNGSLLGRRAPNTVFGGQAQVSASGVRWETANSRAVRVPAALAPPGASCLSGRADLTGSCLEGTYVGTYQPLPYLLPAAAIDLSESLPSASWAARAAAALPALAFLILAVAAAWTASAWSLVGLLAALTPMVLFVTSILNPSGLEVSAGTALMVVLLRIGRARDEVPRWAWAALAIAGAVTILSWQLGPGFVALDGLLILSLIGRAGVTALGRRYRRELTLVGLTLGGALAAYLVYLASAGTGGATFALDKVGDLHAGFDQLVPVIKQSVGTFGRLTVPLPAVVTDVWLLIVGVLAVAGLLLGNRRERLTLLAALALSALVTVLFDALIYRHTGFGLQARYLLPLFVTVPLIAGETVRSAVASGRPREASSGSPAHVVPLGLALIALLQLAAWWVNARHSAGRSNEVWFLSNPRWSPPLGWAPWLVAAVAGAAMLAVGGTLAARRSPLPLGARRIGAG